MHSPRAQADKRRYQTMMKRRIEEQANLTLRQELVEEILLESTTRTRRRVIGVRTRGNTVYHADAVILTTGTFLKALMHTGEARTRGGRAGDNSAEGLSLSLAECGIALARFKTGTPCRLNGRTIDFGRLERQQGDATPRPFSFCYRSHRTTATRLSHHLYQRSRARLDQREPRSCTDVLGPYQ